MALFPSSALNPGVARREVFGWAMYDFANSGYTTVVLTAVFNAYFVAAVAGNAAWATLAWTLSLAASRVLVMLTMPTLGAWADLRAAKKRLLVLTTIACVVTTAALALGQGADEFLGTQGDPWDTQSDMFLALLGAIAAQLFCARRHDRQLAALGEPGPTA